MRVVCVYAYVSAYVRVCVCVLCACVQACASARVCVGEFPIDLCVRLYICALVDVRDCVRIWRVYAGVCVCDVCIRECA